jgi:ATP-dependent DNA helicase RecG
MLSLEDPVENIPGIGPKRAGELKKAGVSTAGDFLNLFPFRYEDRSRFSDIAGLRENETGTVRAEILAQRLFTTRSRFTIYEITVRDGSGEIRAAFYNQPYLKQSLAPGRVVVLHGRVKLYRNRWLSFENPAYEILEPGDTDSVHTGRIVPIYHRIGKIPAKGLRTAMLAALESLPGELPEPIPEEVRLRLGLMRYRDALQEVHFPSSSCCDLEALNAGRGAPHRSFAFHEFFRMQLGYLCQKRKRETLHAFRIEAASAWMEKAADLFPFALTQAQERVVSEIACDLEKPHPMNRLLQGEVGSGKTVVALLAMLAAVESGFQAALMVPTEILAEQHFRNCTRVLEKTGWETVLLTGSVPAPRKREVLEKIAHGSARVVIGTHALIQSGVRFSKLALNVIDEQHRFGVIQRGLLAGKGRAPHLLLMTATPIPRTTALTVYGDMDVSFLNELPSGRIPIKTVVRREAQRGGVYTMLRQELEKGNQAYIIYPLIEDSEKLDVRAASAMFENLQTSVFPDFRVGLLHGRLPADERGRVMERFLRGGLDILVSTTVVEVGIDALRATFMIIENGERFGLSQLHQMRGRIGRGAAPSTCVIMGGSRLKPEAWERLAHVAQTSNGLEIAEKDLEIRGPGDLFGTRQSGNPGFHVVNILRFPDLLALARHEASEFLKSPGAVSRDIIGKAEAYWEKHFRLGTVG